MTEEGGENPHSGSNLTAKPTSAGVHFKFFPRFDGGLQGSSKEGKKVKREGARVVLGTASAYQSGGAR